MFSLYIVFFYPSVHKGRKQTGVLRTCPQQLDLFALESLLLLKQSVDALDEAVCVHRAACRVSGLGSSGRRYGKIASHWRHINDARG